MRFFLPASAFLLLALPAQAASFDCGKARLPDERTVCASRVISELDVEMAVRFQTLSGLVAMGTRGNMGDEQREFLNARRRCANNQPCLSAAYHRRIDVLKRQYQQLQQRGPFWVAVFPGKPPVFRSGCIHRQKPNLLPTVLDSIADAPQPACI